LFKSIDKEKLKALKMDITEEKSTKIKNGKKRRIKREYAKFKRPVKSAGPFGFYLRSLDRGDASIADFAKGASLKWHALAAQDKEVFFKQAQEAREEYQKKMSEWETKMFAEGHENLVRKSFLKKINKTLNKKANQMMKMRKRKAIALKAKKRKEQIKNQKIKRETKQLQTILSKLKGNMISRIKTKQNKSVKKLKASLINSKKVVPRRQQKKI